MRTVAVGAGGGWAQERITASPGVQARSLLARLEPAIGYWDCRKSLDGLSVPAQAQEQEKHLPGKEVRFHR